MAKKRSRLASKSGLKALNFLKSQEFNPNSIWPARDVLKAMKSIGFRRAKLTRKYLTIGKVRIGLFDNAFPCKLMNEIVAHPEPKSGQWVDMWNILNFLEKHFLAGVRRLPKVLYLPHCVNDVIRARVAMTKEVIEFWDKEVVRQKRSSILSKLSDLKS